MRAPAAGAADRVPPGSGRSARVGSCERASSRSSSSRRRASWRSRRPRQREQLACHARPAEIRGGSGYDGGRPCELGQRPLQSARGGRTIGTRLRPCKMPARAAASCTTIGGRVARTAEPTARVSWHTACSLRAWSSVCSDRGESRRLDPGGRPLSFVLFDERPATSLTLGGALIVAGGLLIHFGAR